MLKRKKKHNITTFNRVTCCFRIETRCSISQNERIDEKRSNQILIDSETNTHTRNKKLNDEGVTRVFLTLSTPIKTLIKCGFCVTRTFFKEKLSMKIGMKLLPVSTYHHHFRINDK